MPIASLQKTLGHRSLDKTVLYARIADPVVQGIIIVPSLPSKRMAKLREKA
jgi:hypothetical protein